MRRLATAHVNPAKLALFSFWQIAIRTVLAFRDGAALSMHSRTPLLVRTVTDDLLKDLARDADHLQVLRALAPQSLILAPLVARGRM